MVSFNVHAVLVSTLAASVLASPYHGHHGHSHHHHSHQRGSGTRDTALPYPTDGPYGMGNSSTIVAPTGGTSVTTSVTVIYSTQTVVPIPASTIPSEISATTGSTAPVSELDVGIIHNRHSSTACDYSTITITTQNTITVTVGDASSSEITAPPLESAATTVQPTSTSTSNVASPDSSVAPTYVATTPAVSSALPSPSRATSTSSFDTFSKSLPTTHFPSTGNLPFTSASAPQIVTASSTSSAVAAPSSHTTVSKRGLVYNDAGLTDYFANSSTVSWAYNWGSTSTGLPGCFSFVPMLWGSEVGDFTSNAAAAIKSGVTHLLAFNEPDMTKQYGGSQIDPSTAADLYKTNMMPFAGKAKLGAPAVTNANSTSPAMGLPWLQQFYTACAGDCQIDFVPCHWYGYDEGTAAQQAQVLREYLETVASEVEQIFGKKMPLWLTEFAAKPLNDAGVNSAFLEIALPYLDNSADIERYSFFMVSQGSLISNNGLSSMGSTYLQTI